MSQTVSHYQRVCKSNTYRYYRYTYRYYIDRQILQYVPI